eukprot:CAMPEP_0118710100 /NCGR_PEP_ID=MMETSP0800-20121206/23133_1 /TAXON_ID=210618 ORGANISM="Striatella unipunctata, Strain CCMP2910" /NCGR_SAMPLE_ID=MMETSP0800 /ASSEMBLY_ACC=CAM_ASM_000638 /LENGTH=111 /DNA_ID=CAMNT_0006614123 /DNA_START=114 /DNA_END=446 /DNA_ORIENTATION=-
MLQASEGQIWEGMRGMQCHQQEAGETFRPITLNHLSVVNVRNPGNDIIISQDNTTQQARALDATRAQLQEQQTAAEADAAVCSRTIHIQIRGHWMNVNVDLHSLRVALGFP